MAQPDTLRHPRDVGVISMRRAVMTASLVGCVLSILLVVGCSAMPQVRGNVGANSTLAPVASPDPTVPAALLGRWMLTSTSPEAWLRLDFRTGGVVVLDRGVATYSGSYSWSNDRLTIESAGLQYAFDAHLEPTELTLRNQQMGTVVYRRADQ